MIKLVLPALTLALVGTAAPTFAQAAAPASPKSVAPSTKLSLDSPIAELQANPVAWAIVVREIPLLEQVADRVGTLTLRGLNGMRPEVVTDEKMKSIGEQLAALP